MKIFKIHADYRPLKAQKTTNYYYVCANTKKEARQKFNEIISWLKIFSIEECSKEQANKVKNNPYHFILFQ